MMIDPDMAQLATKVIDPDWDDPIWEVDLVQRLHDGLDVTIGIPLCDLAESPSGFSPVEAWKLQRGAERAMKLQVIEDDKRWAAFWEERAKKAEEEEKRILSARFFCDICRIGAVISKRHSGYTVACPWCRKTTWVSHDHMLRVLEPESSGVLKEG